MPNDLFFNGLAKKQPNHGTLLHDLTWPAKDSPEPKILNSSTAQTLQSV